MKPAKKKKAPLPDHTNHEEIKDALRDSDRKYRELVELLPQTVFEIDRNGKITFVNPVALDTFGYSEEEFRAGVNVFDVFVQEDHARLMANIQKILSGEKLSGIEYTARKKDGSTIPVMTYSVPVILENIPVGLRGVLIDISDRKAAEEALRESKDLYQTLAESSPEMIYLIDHKGCIRYVNSLAARQFNKSPAELIGKNLDQVFPPDIARDHMEGITRTIETGQTKSSEILESFPEGNFWISARLSPVKNATGEVTQVLGLSSDITEKKRAEEALRESEEKFRRLAETTHDIIVTTDFDGIITYANPAARNLVGGQEIVGVSIKEFMPEDLIEKHKEMLNARRQGFFGTLSFEWKLRLPKDGSIMLLDVVSAVLRDKNTPSGILFNARDITERRKSEEARLQTLSLLEATLESTADGILVVNASGTIVNYNRKFAQMWHIPEAVLAMHDDTLALNHIREQLQDPEGFLQKVRELYATPLAVSFDTIAFRDGRVFERYSQPQSIGDKVIGRVWSFRDITERKLAEERLRFLAKVSDAAPASITVHDFDGRFLYANEETFRLHGYTREEFLAKNLHEIDVPQSEQLIAARMQKIQESGEESFDVQHLRKDGSVFPLNVQVKIIDWGGRKSLLSIATDITVRKQAEESLRLSEEKFRGVIENLQDVFYRTDTAGNITMASPSVAEVFGYSSVDEVIGLNLSRDFYNDPAKRLEFLNEIKKTGTVRNFEADLKKKDGTLITVSTSAHYYRDPDGNILGIEGIAKDITEWKHAEEALRVSEEKYRVVAEMAKDGIAIVQGTKVMYVNPSLARIGGYSVEELTGASFIRFVAPESVAGLLSIIKNAFLGKPVPEFFTTRIRHRDGHIIEIEANGTVITWEGKKALLGIVRDVTERNRIEKELRKYSEKLEEMVAERTEKLNNSLGEKEVLLREVHHRVKNNLQIIISLLNLQSRYITDEKTLAAIRESQNRVKAMALVHEKLHQSPDISKINLNDYIKFLGNSLFRFYGMMGKGVRLTTDIHDLYLDINTTIPLGLITNELVSNSLKYAFPPGKKGEISIAITRENDVLTAVFKDNGAGMPMDFDWRNAKSLGLRLVISLVEQLQGTIELDRTSGTMFTMVLHEKQQ